MKKIGLLLIGFLMAGIINNVFAQENLSVVTDGSDMTIYGTSSLHDWEIVAEKMTGNCQATIENSKVTSVDNLVFNVIVNGLKSGKSGMDDNTYKALSSDKYPKINFKLNSVERSAASKDEESTIFVTKGTLTVAGFAKDIDLKVAAKKTSEGGVQFIGKTVFNMTDFKVDPPTAVFGTIKTGDEITIIFKIIYS
ncbi:MAG: YceI family protein [Vicingaceae bacterium]